MKKFKLAQIVPALNSGGVEQGTIDVANYLSTIKIKNTIISSGGKMLSYLNKKYVNHFELSVNSKNILKMPFLAKKINRIIKENNINILHIRSRGPAWLLPYINKINLKTVSTFHNVYGHQNFIKKIYNKGLTKTDYIVAISQYVKEEIIKIYKINQDNIVVINRGIDTDFYNAKIEEEKKYMEFIKKTNISSDNKIILYPGRLTDWKGQLEFLNIIEQFNNYPYIFYFVGDDKNTSYTKKLVNQIKIKNLSNNCKILGHLEKDDLKMMYHCSDLIISSPIKAEGFGRIVSEGLAMKKMLIAYNYGGVKNQLEGLDDIYKVSPHDQEELRNRIKIVLESPSENFGNIKEKARYNVVQNFSKKLMLEKYTNLYEGISP
jgi:glycosyltransferase involved in cell wall biosynthesis